MTQGHEREREREREREWTSRGARAIWWGVLESLTAGPCGESKEGGLYSRLDTPVSMCNAETGCLGNLA